MNWCQAAQYCEWLGKRLPTEAEWEMGVRGSCETTGFAVGSDCSKSMRIYPWGDELATCDYAVMYQGGDGCGQDSTWAVGSKSPAGNSPYGLQDMAGNVWEWVQDCYVSYSPNAVTNPVDESCSEPETVSCAGDFRVVRGGGVDAVGAGSLRASNRDDADPSLANLAQGFRCAKSIP